MKKYIVVFLFTILVLGACKDEEVMVVDTSIPGVEKLIATSDAEGVLLSWENPDDRLYDKVEISYTIEGEKITITEAVNERSSSVEIMLPDTEVYKFYIQAFSSTNSKVAREQSVKSRKIAPSDPEDELLDMLNSIVINGGDGGVRVLWENPQAIPAVIRLRYDDQELEINANSLRQEYSLRGLDLNRVYTFTADVLYADAFSTSVKTFAVTPLAGFSKLKNDNWNITASSTQSGLSAIDLLDNDPSTYWRSSQYVTVSGAPTGQHVIVDFNRIRRFSALTIHRKWGDGENSSWDINISFSEDGVVYTTPYMYKNAAQADPNPVFVKEFNRTIDGEQLYLLPKTHTARYVRVDFVRGATNAYAVYGDINFYGE